MNSLRTLRHSLFEILLLLKYYICMFNFTVELHVLYVTRSIILYLSYMFTVGNSALLGVRATRLQAFREEQPTGWNTRVIESIKAYIIKIRVSVF